MLNFQPPEEDSQQSSSEYDDEVDAGAQVVLNNLKNYDENEELPENDFAHEQEVP